MKGSELFEKRNAKSVSFLQRSGPFSKPEAKGQGGEGGEGQTPANDTPSKTRVGVRKGDNS